MNNEIREMMKEIAFYAIDRDKTVTMDQRAYTGRGPFNNMSEDNGFVLTIHGDDMREEDEDEK